MQSHITPKDFTTKWDLVTLNERATAQEHFIDLCHLLHVKTPNEADPHGTFYRFEKPLTKAGNGAGFADVWRKDHFVWEYKTKNKYPDLKAAYKQLLLYKSDLDNPPILIACDLGHYEVHIEFTGHRSKVILFVNADLQNTDTRDLLRLAFTDVEQLRPREHTSTITEVAAARFAQIAQLLEKRGFAPTQIAPLFTKLLFAFFAEDIRLLPDHLLTQTLYQCIFNPHEFPARIRALFRTMRDGGYFGLHWIPRFNGGLFDDDDVLALNANEIQFLYDAASLDWGQVEPSIFGTVFERSLDPRQRAQLGAHYTHKDDILLLVEPVLMTPLRREWGEVKQRVEELRSQWKNVSGNGRRKLQSTAEGVLLDFMERLAHMRILDPACGSGNFLYVSLAQLKDLEKEVRTYAAGAGLAEPELGVTPSQFYGIEKNIVATQLARIVVWIGYLQWQRANGFWETEDPILQSLNTIQCRDAILTVDLHGNPQEPEWPEADVIVGNPPFLGTKKLKSGLGTAYVTALHSLYSDRIPGFSDLVCYWFERSRTEISTGRAKRAGLLATNSIRFGENRRVLESIKEDGDIFFGRSDLPWTLQGAAVRISMVGFDNGTETTRELDGTLVKDINPDLTSGTFEIKEVKPLLENTSISFLGDVKGGSFDIPHDLAQEMINDTSSSIYPNSDVIKRTANADDITKKWRNYWLIDFGTSMSLEEAKKYAKPFQYVEAVVRPEREKGKPSRCEWWLHMRPGPSMRKAITALPRYIATPALSKHRLFIWFTPDILPSHAIVVFGRADDYFFGILHSKPHELWSLRLGSSLEDRPRYTPTTCFETYPFPWSPGHEPQNSPCVEAIAAAARDLIAQRDAWLNPAEVWNVDLKKRTLTNLYNMRPDWLTEAHQRLDAAVFAAYEWPSDLSDDEILVRLLALNLERAVLQDITR